jgi:hypothetical protein
LGRNINGSGNSLRSLPASETRTRGGRDASGAVPGTEMELSFAYNAVKEVAFIRVGGMDRSLLDAMERTWGIGYVKVGR